MANSKLIGERIRILREASKETQSALAQALGVQRQIISYYETGARTPGVDDLIKLASHYETTVDYLLGRSDVKSVELTLQEVCDYTGLKEKSVVYLHENPHICPLLDILIDQSNNNEILNILAERPDASKAEAEHAKQIDMVVTRFISTQKEWEENHTGILRALMYYLFLDADSSEKELIISECGEILDKEKFARWNGSIDDYLKDERLQCFAIKTLRQTDLVESVLLSDIQDRLKKLRVILKEGVMYGQHQ